MKKKCYLKKKINQPDSFWKTQSPNKRNNNQKKKKNKKKKKRQKKKEKEITTEKKEKNPKKKNIRKKKETLEKKQEKIQILSLNQNQSLNHLNSRKCNKNTTKKDITNQDLVQTEDISNPADPTHKIDITEINTLDLGLDPEKEIEFQSDRETVNGKNKEKKILKRKKNKKEKDLFPDKKEKIEASQEKEIQKISPKFLKKHAKKF